MEFPRHVHKPAGVSQIVHDQAACDAALAEGWALTPVLTEAQQAAVRAAQIAAGELVEPVDVPVESEPVAVPVSRGRRGR